MEDQNKHCELVIIGGGPAGVTAGIYASRRKLNTLLITKNFSGQVGKTSRVDNYPGFSSVAGLELASNFEKHLKNFEIGILEGEEVVDVEKTGEEFRIKTNKGKEFFSLSVIVATGADPRPLEVPGEKKYLEKGVYYCPKGNTHLFKDKVVAIIGGGDSGFEVAFDLLPYAKHILIFEKTDKIRADETLQAEVKKEDKVEILKNKEIKEIIGNEKSVQALCYRDTSDGKDFQVPVSGVFVQVGLIPATGFLEGLVEFSDRDEIKVDFETCATKTPGLFAAGDVNNGKWKQIVIATGEGARAALEVYGFVKKIKS